MSDPYGPHQMNHETPHDDLTVSLHHHFDRRFNDLEKRIDQRFDASEKATQAAMAAAEKAVLKAEALATTRADQQNEWRATVTDLIATTMSREAYDAAHLTLVEKIDALTERVNRAEGTGTGAAKAVSYAFLTAAFVFGLGGLIFGLIELLTR